MHKNNSMMWSININNDVFFKYFCSLNHASYSIKNLIFDFCISSDYHKGVFYRDNRYLSVWLYLDFLNLY